MFEYLIRYDSGFAILFNEAESERRFALDDDRLGVVEWWHDCVGCLTAQADFYAIPCVQFVEIECVFHFPSFLTKNAAALWL